MNTAQSEMAIGITAKLAELDNEFTDHPYASEAEEELVVSYILDYPDQFPRYCKYFSPALFFSPNARIAAAILLQHHEKFGFLQHRELVWGYACHHIQGNDPEPFLAALDLIKAARNPRDYASIMDRLLDWLQKQAYSRLFSDDEVIKSVLTNDFDMVNTIVDDARRVGISDTKLLDLDDDLDEILRQDDEVHIPTGIKGLDALLSGGPSPREVLMYVAPTGRGKSLMLVNSAIAARRAGYDVLYITLELAGKLAARRALASEHKINQSNVVASRDKILRGGRVSDNRGRVKFLDLNIHSTTNDIRAFVDTEFKVNKWSPRVIIVDYLDLLKPATVGNDRESTYIKLKTVAEELRGLAQERDVVVLTASQTNRSGLEGTVDLSQISESFGKTMSTDYIITFNVDGADRRCEEPVRSTLNLEKNRNGRSDFVPIWIDYARSLAYDRNSHNENQDQL